MKYVSLFAGIGGFDLALNRLGHECVYANEWDKYSAQTYEKNFGYRSDTTDITKVSTDSIPDHDLLVGGFPCQAFSIAGKRKGFGDTRGTLFFDIARIVKEKRPRYLLLENVKGLLSHDSGRTFKIILSTLTKLGYDLQTMVLNSKNFGVPQNRERVFIVGHLRGQPRPKVFPIGESNKRNIASQGAREFWGNKDSQLATTLKQRDYKGGGNLIQLNQPKHSNDRIYGEDGISPTLNTAQGGRRQPKIMRYPLKFLQRNQKNIEGDYSFTVDGANTGGVMIAKTVRSGGRKSPHGSKQNWDSYAFGQRIRRLTPLECERLQGFPDGWTKYGLSCIMEICVNTTDAIVDRLLKLDTVLCTTSDSKDTEIQISQQEKNPVASMIIDGLWRDNSVTGITSLGKGMVMLFNQKETLNIEELPKKKDTYEKMVGQSTYKLWNITLEENLAKKKLSTILTLIRETMISLTSTYAKTDENIIGCIIHLKPQEQISIRDRSLNLRMVNTILTSDTQRYKQLGNAVTVNVVEEIVKRMFPN